MLKVGTESKQINLNHIRQNYKNGLFQSYSICGIADTQVVSLDSVNLNLTSTAGQSKYLPPTKFFYNTGLNAVEINNIQR